MIKKCIFLVLVVTFITVSFISIQVSACTVFTVKTKDTILVGRNFDWSKKGGRIWFIPSKDSKNGMTLIEQISNNMPFEGMNDKGLFVGMAAVPGTNVPFSLLKPMVKSLELIKLVLSKASTVQESLLFFSNNTILFGETFGHPLIHYMVADQSGNSAVIEFFNSEINIIKKEMSYQLITNHYLTDPEYGNISESSKSRFKIAKTRLDSKNIDELNITDIALLLKDTSQGRTGTNFFGTIWSSIYDPKTKKIFVYYDRRYHSPAEYDLLKELKKGEHNYAIDQGAQGILRK